MAEHNGEFTTEDHLQDLRVMTDHLIDLVTLAGIACSPAAQPCQQKEAVTRLFQQLRRPI
jgi:hypothetical protein